MLRCDVDFPIFLLQWVSALEPQALTFTLKDHKMATFTVSYSTSEKTELLHEKERTWSWRGVREEITSHSRKHRTNAEIVKTNKQTNKPRRQQMRSGNFCDCTILETVIRFTAQWWICYFFVYYKMCIQVTCFTLCQISISWNFPLKYTCWIILTNTFHLFVNYLCCLYATTFQRELFPSLIVLR